MLAFTEAAVIFLCYGGKSPWLLCCRQLQKQLVVKLASWTDMTYVTQFKLHRFEEHLKNRQKKKYRKMYTMYFQDDGCFYIDSNQEIVNLECMC